MQVNIRTLGTIALFVEVKGRITPGPITIIHNYPKALNDDP